MGKYILSVIFTFICYCTGFGQSHGLEFSSHEVVPEKRTGLQLTAGKPICIDGEMDISFDLQFRPGMETYFGYVMRLITTEGQNIDLVYNQRLFSFNFVIGETFTRSFVADTLQLYGGWNRFRIHLNPQQQEASCYFNNRLVCKGRATLPPAACCHLLFGASSLDRFQTLDLPPMSLKDIRINQNGRLAHFFPLADNGTDEVKGLRAAIKNPVWIKPRHQHWQLAHRMYTGSSPALAFDARQEVLYIITRDTLYHLSVKDGQFGGEKLARSRDTLLPGHQGVYDVHTGLLHDFYIDQQRVSTYRPAEKEWSDNFTPAELGEYWHANKFLSPADSSLYIIAGYGQLQYKNKVQRYHFPTKRWELVASRGDSFMPRYLAALGTTPGADTAFIIGGYGSITGNQAINPKYVYDLLAYSVKDHSFRHLYQLPEPEQQFCFANSLVIDAARHHFYALVHPKDRFNSQLHLIKGSLQKPEYQRMGDSIPYSFHDIRSFADLYYAPTSKKLVAVTFYTAKNNVTQLNAYTLDFPPNPAIADVPAVPRPFNPGRVLLGLACVLTAGALFFFVWKRWQFLDEADTPGQEASPAPPAEKTPEAAAPVERSPAIYLFGEFEVVDKEGHDCTKLFTPLLKELFLLLLIHTIKNGKGITSEKLYELLWEDKPLKDARNNFSVNVVKLKAILEKTGGMQILKDAGRWKLEVTDPALYIDYHVYMQQAAGSASIPVLREIADRGSFLKNVPYEWLDNIKSDVSIRITDLLLGYMAHADLQRETEFVLQLAHAVFQFDQLNEEALAYKCRCLILSGRHKIAQDAYLKFAKEYKESYGQDYEKSFREITREV